MPILGPSSYLTPFPPCPAPAPRASLLGPGERSLESVCCGEAAEPRGCGAEEGSLRPLPAPTEAQHRGRKGKGPGGSSYQIQWDGLEWRLGRGTEVGGQPWEEGVHSGWRGGSYHTKMDHLFFPPLTWLTSLPITVEATVKQKVSCVRHCLKAC